MARRLAFPPWERRGKCRCHPGSAGWHSSLRLSARSLFSLFLYLDRPLPAFNRHLLGTRYGQLAFRRILGQRRAGTQRGTLANAYRRDELGVAADEGVVFDHGAEFVGAVIVASDRAGADIDARAHRGITDIGQMIGFAVRRD